MMTVKGPRALIKRVDAPLKSTVIEVIEHNPNPSQFAHVLAVGNGRRLEDGTRRAMDIKPGDVIITKEFCGTPVEFEGEDLYMIMEDDALAVVIK